MIWDIVIDGISLVILEVYLLKDTQKDTQKKELSHSQKKVAGTRKRTINEQIEAAYAAALSQGVIPHTDNDELLAALSRLGNSSFLKIYERKNSINRALEKYTGEETFSPESVGLLKEKLAGDPVQEVNKVELMPVIDKPQPIPDLVGKEGAYFSTLSPIPFDQGIINT